MSDIEEQGEAPESAVAEGGVSETSGPGCSPFVQSVSTAEGIGEVIDQSFQHAEAYMRPQLQYLRDPSDGTTVPVSVSKDGVSQIQPSLFDAWRTNPRYRSGTATMTDLASFIAHVNRFSTPESALFACDDRDRPSLRAVLDYHDRVNVGDGDADFGANALPQHGRHGTRFNFPLSDEWKAWGLADGKKMSMIEFAMFLEDRIIDVLDRPEDVTTLPDALQRLVTAVRGNIASPSKLLELATGLKVFENSTVQEAHNLASGEGEVKFQSEHVDETGNKLVIPNMFLIGIPVFKKGDQFRLAARLRYRKQNGLTFWFELWRPDLVFDTAFTEACGEAEAATGLPLFFGSPEAT
ncbi:DUF2303 family protein [Sphingomonas sp.]|uniref:DUF2303 family protein n=1 Tax=Sphingomonas sp. TaxID=28214 RepID=UPI00307EB3E3